MFALCSLCFLDSMYQLSVVAFIPEIMVRPADALSTVSPDPPMLSPHRLTARQATQSPMHAALVFSLYYLAVLFGNRQPAPHPLADEPPQASPAEPSWYRLVPGSFAAAEGVASF